MMAIKVHVRLNKFAAALKAADRGIPFTFLREGPGPDVAMETTGLVPVVFLPEIVTWYKKGAVRDFAMTATSALAIA